MHAIMNASSEKYPTYSEIDIQEKLHYYIEMFIWGTGLSQLISNKSVKVTPRLESQVCAGEEALNLDGRHSIENVHGWEARGVS